MAVFTGLGSNAAPSFTFSSDTNTGMYSPGADQLALSTNGTGRLFVNANGNVGVGAAATTRLEVARQGAAWTGVSPIAGTALFVHSGSASTTSAARMSILSGNAIDAAIYFGDTDNNAEAIIKLDNTDDSLQFAVNGPERLRITSAGRLLVGTSSDSGGALLQINGDRIRVATAKTPASASDTGTTGEICWDTSYIYVCTATNTWKRAALSTW